MKYILEKCEGHVCVKDKNGKEISKWSNVVLEKMGGLEKIVERYKKSFPKLEVEIVNEAPEPQPAPVPEPQPAPVPEPQPAPGN